MPEEINEPTVNTVSFQYLSIKNRSNRKKINKEIVEFNSIINQLAITGINSLFQPKESVYTFFSSSHGTFTKGDYMPGYKTHLIKPKRIEIIQCLHSEYSVIKIEINNRDN